MRLDSVAPEGVGDDTGNAARFNTPRGIVYDAVSGFLYVAYSQSHVIRRVTTAGVVSFLAGSGVAGFADGAGDAVQFNKPAGIAIGSDGRLYVTDKDNHRLRVLDIIN